MTNRFKQLKFRQLDQAIKERKMVSIEGVGQRIKDIREAVGMTQKQMAKRLKVSQSAVSQIEENAGSSSLKTILKFVETLGLDFEGAISSKASLVNIVAERAAQTAKRIVDRTYANMAMEKQSPSRKAYQQELRRLTNELIANPGPELWEE